MKRKIFIGSSSEGHKVAELIKNEINDQLSDWIECETWKGGDVFDLNTGTLDSLLKATRKYDYGIFIATADDDLTKRDVKSKVMRDNVLFESGLFLGSLGLRRAFLLTHFNVGLPTDFNGTTLLTFDENNLNEVQNKIVKELENTRYSFCLKPLPSTALALTYFNNFVTRFAEKRLKHQDSSLKILIPDSTDNIWGQIKKYKLNHKSYKTIGGRPIAYRYINKRRKYWDIPTVLETIGNVIDLFIHSNEIGINKEKEEWIRHEIRNFEGTLTVLVNKHLYGEKIKIEYL